MHAIQTPRTGEFIALLRRSVPDKTVRHSISVAELMATVAADLGLDHERSVAAGLLHDLCKGMKGSELLDASRELGLRPTLMQISKPKLLHGPLAAEICRQKLGIRDNDVLEAIRWHTTGRPGLPALGLALYFADFAEPLREHPQAAEALDLYHEEGFYKALRYVSASKLAYIRGNPMVDPITESFHAWLQKQVFSPRPKGRPLSPGG